MSFARKPASLSSVTGLDVTGLDSLSSKNFGDAFLRLFNQVMTTKAALRLCCAPTGCKRCLESSIRSDDQADAVRVVCSNPECSMGQWMHSDCFNEWEKRVTICVRSFVPAESRGWNEGQEMRQGLELALKACSCICGKGYIRKDLGCCESKGSTAVNTQQMKQHRPHHNHHRRRHYQESQQVQQQLQHQVQHQVQQSVQQQVRWIQEEGSQIYDGEKVLGNTIRDPPYQLRVRTFSFSSTGSSPASSTATPPPISPRRSSGTSPSIPSRSPTPTPEAILQATTATSSGNIFRHRTDMSAFRVLPKTVQNHYHIKVEDEGPHGNDKIRSFLMMNLTRNQIKEIHCVVCETVLPIFDEFPLIDGTFFLSPRRYTDNITLVFERRLVYLNAVCLRCLEGSKTSLLCQGCLTPWDGSSFIIGTMYSYDIFGAMSCCRSRLTCVKCQRTIDDPQNLKYFSEYSRLVRCPHCELDDYHFLKALREIFFFKTL